MGGHGLDRSDSAKGQVTGTCKRVNEPSDSIKLGKLSCPASQEGLCSME